MINLIGTNAAGVRQRVGYEDLGLCPDGVYFVSKFYLESRKKPVLVLTRLSSVLKGGPGTRAQSDRAGVAAAAGVYIL